MSRKRSTTERMLDRVARGEDPKEAYLREWIAGSGFGPTLKGALHDALGLPQRREDEPPKGETP